MAFELPFILGMVTTNTRRVVFNDHHPERTEKALIVTPFTLFPPMIGPGAGSSGSIFLIAERRGGVEKNPRGFTCVKLVSLEGLASRFDGQGDKEWFIRWCVCVFVCRCM